jgi:hypothetical protein
VAASCSHSLLALHNDEYTHLLLILPVSATLILLEWRSQKPIAQASFRIGSALLLAAVLIAGFAKCRAADLMMCSFHLAYWRWCSGGLQAL